MEQKTKVVIDIIKEYNPLIDPNIIESIWTQAFHVCKENYRMMFKVQQANSSTIGELSFFITGCDDSPDYSITRLSVSFLCNLIMMDDNKHLIDRIAQALCYVENGTEKKSHEQNYFLLKAKHLLHELSLQFPIKLKKKPCN